MSQAQDKDVIRTRIWAEETEPGNPFGARAAYCHGYDVYGAMVGNARWVEMLFLLLRGEAPSAQQANLLEALAVTLANPGPRDPAVHAAMCGGVGGSTAASCLMAALAVGAGQFCGAREVYLAMQAWSACGTQLGAWQAWIEQPPAPVTGIWPEVAGRPGFDAYAATSPGIVRAALAALARRSPGPHLPWLAANLSALEAAAGGGVTLTAVAAAALIDLGFAPAQGEMLCLLLRLPGAAAHALEQQDYGHKKFPFFEVELAAESDDRVGRGGGSR
ncbi:MAG TPA: citryl-CoA lyase [Burkholderiaceae bacterium]|nr:citryl-CoA lyase [Burkholderiaceae bacterium]